MWVSPSGILPHKFCFFIHSVAAFVCENSTMANTIRSFRNNFWNLSGFERGSVGFPIAARLQRSISSAVFYGTLSINTEVGMVLWMRQIEITRTYSTYVILQALQLAGYTRNCYSKRDVHKQQYVMFVLYELRDEHCLLFINYISHKIHIIL